MSSFVVHGNSITATDEVERYFGHEVDFVDPIPANLVPAAKEQAGSEQAEVCEAPTVRKRGRPRGSKNRV